MDAGATVRCVFKAHADRLRLIQTETITWKALVRLDTPALHLITVNFHSRGRYPSFIVTILSGNLHSGIETGAARNNDTGLDRGLDTALQKGFVICICHKN